VPKDRAFSHVTTNKEVKSADDSFIPSGVQLLKAHYVTRRQVAVAAAAMTDRDRAIVTTLGIVRVATAGQLLSLHGADITTRRAQAVLTSLVKRQVLARMTRVMGGVRAGSSGYIYTLGPVGVRLLVPSRKGRPWEVGTLFLAHSLAISQLHTDLVLAERAGTFERVDFASEPGCWRSFFGLGGERIVLKPDAYVRLRLGRYEDRWFVEVDMGTEPRSTIARKAEFYRRYRQSGTEQAKVNVFPRVLFVVPDDARKEVITEVLSRQPADAWQLFVVARMDEAVSRLARGAGV
jgi:hypothetical protein